VLVVWSAQGPLDSWYGEGPVALWRDWPMTSPDIRSTAGIFSRKPPLNKPLTP